MTIRDEVLELIYSSLSVPIEKEVFLKSVKDWEVFPIYSGETLAGGFLLLGAEMHVGIAKDLQKKIFWRKYFRKYMLPVIGKYGFVYTIVPKSNLRSKELMIKTGFVLEQEDPNYWYLKCTRINYV
jgi:hypothetical protein